MITNKFLLWSPVVGWAGLIFVLSSIPGLSSGLEIDTLLRKTAHVAEYYILTFLLYRAFKGTWNLTQGVLILYAALGAVLYAVSDELHQSFVPYRNGTITDVCIDSVGVLLFCLFRTQTENIFEKFILIVRKLFKNKYL